VATLLSTWSAPVNLSTTVRATENASGYATILVGGEGAEFQPQGPLLRSIRIVSLLILVLAFFPGIHPARGNQGNGKANLDYVLSMMDRSAQDFRSLTAAIEHIKYTAVVKDTSTESGEIYVRKDAKMRIDFQSPDPRTILRNGDNLYIYTPKINRVEEYNI
jgi:outer membrane lipoprotein-sorting protein